MPLVSTNGARSLPGVAAGLVLVIYLLGGLAEGNDLKWGELSWNGDGLGTPGLLLELPDPLQELGELARVEGRRCRRLRGGAVQ